MVAVAESSRCFITFVICTSTGIAGGLKCIAGLIGDFDRGREKKHANRHRSRQIKKVTQSGTKSGPK